MSEEHELRVGVAHGGPFDGREFTVRKPDGIIAVNPITSNVVVYDLVDDVFLGRDEEPLDREKMEKSIDEWRYEVIPYGA